VILRWLIERYRCEVVAFCADRASEELIPVRDKALRTAPPPSTSVDLREEFVRDFIFRCCGQPVYEGAYPWALRSPAAHRARQVEIAQEGADAVATRTGKATIRSASSSRTPRSRASR